MSVDWDQVTGACMGVFGEVVTHCPPNHAEQPVTGVFDEAHLPVLPMGGGNGQEGMQFGAAGNVTEAAPVLGVQLRQFLTPPAQKDGIRMGPARGNKLFSVKEVQPDGHGWALLLLMDA